MIALQVASDLDAALASWAVLCVVGVVVGTAGSALIRRSSNSIGKYRLLYRGVVFPYGLVAYGLLRLLGFGVAVQTSLVPGIGGIAATAVAVFTTTLAAGVAVLAMYAPTVRGVRAVREIELTTPAAVARMARWGFGVCVFLSATLVALNRFNGVSGMLAIIVGIGVVVPAASPWLIVVLRSTRPLAADEAERLARLRDRAGLSVRDTRVLETGDADTATAHVRGPPGYRRLFVSDAFLDRFDSETATALLAVEAGRVRTHVLARRVGGLLGAGILAVIGYGVSSLIPATIAAFSVLLIGLWFTRRGVRAADDYADERVGTDAVVTAFEQYAAIHGMESSRNRFPNPLSTTVALGDRIDRLDETQSSPTD